MNLTLRTSEGFTEAIIDDDCGLNRFYQVAHILAEKLKLSFIRKEDNFDTLTWNFIYKGHLLSLYFNIYTGISLFPQQNRQASRRDNHAVVEIANMLENSLMVHSIKKYI